MNRWQDCCPLPLTAWFETERYEEVTSGRTILSDQLSSQGCPLYRQIVASTGPTGAKEGELYERVCDVQLGELRLGVDNDIRRSRFIG